MINTDSLKKKAVLESSPGVAEQLKREKYGRACMLIAGNQKRNTGIRMLQELDQAGFTEGTVALARFIHDRDQERSLIKKAADAHNPEGLWEYSAFIPHSLYLDLTVEKDVLWEKTCLEAAEGGIIEAMIDLGEAYERCDYYADAMYLYAMAYIYGCDYMNGHMTDVAQKWRASGSPTDIARESPNFSENMFSAAIAFLQLYSGQKMTLTAGELVDLSLSGAAIAGYLIGNCLLKAEQNELAYKVYNAMAFSGDPHVLKTYADLIAAGKGTAKNMKDAMKIYKMAAEKGERSAMLITGKYLEEKNISIAAYWYGVAYTRGYEKSFQLLEDLSKKM